MIGLSQGILLPKFPQTQERFMTYAKPPITLVDNNFSHDHAPSVDSTFTRNSYLEWYRPQ
jgi:hypothetical protein